MQRCSKENILAGLHQMQTEYETIHDASYLLTYQCVEFTERNRKACVGEMTAFIQEQRDHLLALAPKEEHIVEELLVGQGEDAQLLLHPAVDALLLLSGTPYKWHALKPWQKAWAWFMMGTIYACLIACFCRTIVMR